MKVTSSKPKGQRMFKSVAIKHKSKRPFAIEPIGRGWWFDLDLGEWYDGGYDSTRRSCSGYYAMTRDGFNDVYSLKSAKRLIARWNVPKGTWFRVSTPYVGYHFKIKK